MHARINDRLLVSAADFLEPMCVCDLCRVMYCSASTKCSLWFGRARNLHEIVFFLNNRSSQCQMSQKFGQVLLRLVVYTNIHICVYICIPISLYIYICIHILAYRCAHTYSYACVYQLNLYIHSCVYTYIQGFFSSHGWQHGLS